MAGSHIKGFFLEPRQTFQRQYEALRAVFVDDEPVESVAERFGYTLATLRSMASRLRSDHRQGVTTPFFFRTAEGGPSEEARAADGQSPRRPTSRIVAN